MIPERDDLFERARAFPILEAVGHTLWRIGRRWRGPCPLCGASVGKKADGAFSVDAANNLFHCFACGAGGDAIALERALRGGSPREAAERLVGPAVARPAPAAVVARPRPESPKTDSGMADYCEAVWRASRPADGTPVETYLRARGLAGMVLFRALEELRFHPALRWGDGLSLPAMIAAPRAGGEPTGGLHATFLAPDGQAKTRRTPAKKMFGPQALDGRPGGVFLGSSADGDIGDVVVAEGIETALSAAMLLAPGRPPLTVFAALSLGRLQGGWRTDRFGRIDPAQIQPDPEKPAFAWRGTWREVFVCLDRDMAPIRVKVRRPLIGGTTTRALSPDERAAICGALAAVAWKAAGARKVTLIAPPPGEDFNDMLRSEPAA